jgi:hypothetical protein
MALTDDLRPARVPAVRSIVLRCSSSGTYHSSPFCKLSSALRGTTSLQMNAFTAQHVGAAVKGAILKLEPAIKAAQKLGIFKAKHQVDVLLRPLQVG